jgi:hypothetical protein
MTTLRTDILTDLDDVFFDTDELAETITYGAASIKAIVSYGPNLNVGGDSAQAKCTIKVKKSDVATFAARTSVTIGSDTWKTVREIKADAFTRTIALEKDMRPRLR